MTATTRSTPEFDVVVVGAGFTGIYAMHKFRDTLGLAVHGFDAASDVGGTWYWNRYPGAQCDTASMVYMPLLEETGHMHTEKYAHGPEILEHCQRIGKHFGSPLSQLARRGGQV